MIVTPVLQNLLTTPLSAPPLPCTPLRALHHCLVKKVMYHSRATFKEPLKQGMFFSKQSKILEKRAIGGCFQLYSCKTLQIFVRFVCILCS